MKHIFTSTICSVLLVPSLLNSNVWANEPLDEEGEVIEKTITEKPKDKDDDTGTYFMGGLNILNIDDLNNRLNNNKYEKFGNNVFAWGFGGNININNFLLGGEGFWLWGQDSRSTDKTLLTNLNGAAGFFNFGYNVAIGDFSISPVLGIGGGGISLKINESGAVTFDDYLKNPGKVSEITSSAFLLNPSLALKYRIRFSENFKIRIGLKGGYIWAPFGSGWDNDKIKVTEGPASPITGPYIHFVLE